MKLTTRTEYALLALLYLARQQKDRPVSVATIARACGISPKFLEQIFLQLKRACCLASGKGQFGGYWLARPPARISLAEVIRQLDGPLAPTQSVSRYFHRSTPIDREEGLLNVFREIRDFIAAKMEQTTLADLVGPQRPGRKEAKR